MSKPLVAIVGRPNVGKSTFFNRITGKRISIIKDMPGVTRDRIYADADWSGYDFSLVDTGGIDLKNENEMQKEIMHQVKIATELADIIIFMVDGQEGLTSADQDAADFLRKSKKTIMLVVNKIDNLGDDSAYDFYRLGLGDPYPISAGQGKGLTELLDDLIKHFTKVENTEEDKSIKIAIVGKPNAGKSSILNALLGEDRVVVSSVAGTTRDAIDTPFEYNGKHYTLIDTAGMRRKRGIKEDSIESYSVIRALDAIRRADLVLVVFDAGDVISEQDVRIAGYVHEQGKPSVIIMNKWDLIEKDTHTIEKYNDDLLKSLAFMSYFKSMYISALTRQRINKIMPIVEEVWENTNRRIATGTLNDILQQAILVNEPKTKNGQRLKILYVTQVDVAPPTFILFVNDAKLMHFSYLRYIENTLRRTIKFEGTPIRIFSRDRSDKE
ncbi:MAG: ribosome biogenesis GTPase Der [Clostridia bacterium]|jgi:GTP-binding protein|nr:ribosome biogenesis GTPase Der [Clostridia bacterium]